MIELRDYQLECHKAVEEKGPGRWLIVMATGLGKTATFASLPRKGRTLILAHTRDLVLQPKEYFDCEVGIEMGDTVSNGEEVVIASVQSIKNRLDRFDKNDFDRICVDEAHHATSATYQKVLNHFKPRQLLGFTATPNRADNIGLDAVFDEIIFERDIHFAVTKGFLSNLKCRRVDLNVDLSSIATSMGDFSASQLSKALNIQGANEIIAKTVKEAPKPSIVFCVTIQHAESVAALIEGAEVIVGKTKERAEKLEDFRNGKIDHLVTVGVLTEGVDLPITQSLIIARPTKSAALYTQMVGRVLRLYEGKKHGLVIDMVGNTKDHDLCTPATLLGYEVKGIPESLLEDLEGDIFDLPDMIEQKMETPEVWIKNDIMVDLFRKKNKLRLHDLHYTLLYDGELLLRIPSGGWIGIEVIDLVGETRIISSFDKRSEKMKAQEALDKIFTYLKRLKSKEMPLMKKSSVKRWTSGRKPSVAQLRYCKSMLIAQRKEIDLKALNMYEIKTLLSRLQLERR